MIVTSPCPPSSSSSFSFKGFDSEGGIRHYRASVSRCRRNSGSFAVASSASSSFQPRLPFQYQSRKPEFEEEEEEDDGDNVIGDCLVFEEGAFEIGDPHGPRDVSVEKNGKKSPFAKPKAEVEVESLVPERWRETLEEINMTKKEKRKISLELKFGSRLERRKKLPVPDLEEYRAYREMKLSQLKPLVLDRPREFPAPGKDPVDHPVSSGRRVEPKNPRLGIQEEGLGLISDFFNGPNYVPEENDDDKKSGEFIAFPEFCLLPEREINGFIIS